ncbi:MAG: hypothetical protein ACR2NU_08240 [Aeoliella sp.]
MHRFVTHFLFASGFVLLLASNALAVRVMSTPSTAAGDPAQQFDNIALTPDGNTIVTTGLFDNALTGDRVYSLTVPANPAVDTATVTQLSTNSFLVNLYDVAFPPVISPDGQTILFSHDGNSQAPPTNTIYTMPITGEGSANSFTGLFGVDPNLVSPGTGNFSPVYSPDGSTIYFLNSESAFAGSVPDISAPPSAWAPGPDWDQIYSVPAAGGTPTVVTMPGDGDIDAGLFAVTPNGASIVYAPDNPITERTDRGGVRPKLLTIATTGGTPTEIPITAPGHDFFINRQLGVTADGQTVLFIADYESVGKSELFSVPITGGTPTRISDDLSFAGDVTSFSIAPNGNSVAYAAGQNTSANSELFLTPITGGTGNSIRVSDPAPSNSGAFDVSTSSEGGQILFSNDSSELYYLGDMSTEGVRDLYVVDTTEKTGFVPSTYTFIGPENGDFFDESNWEDADGNPAPTDSINPATPIRLSLLIDGDTVSSGTPPNGAGREADFQVGGSLELTAGSVLIFPEGADELDFNPGSGLKITDATITVFEDIFLEGTNDLNGGLIESLGDDIEFQDGHETSINETTLRAFDNVLIDNSVTSVTGATIESGDRLGMRFEVDFTVTDTNIVINNGVGDVEDAFTGAQGEGSTLTLKGASTLMADTIEDGVDLVLEDTSVATLVGVNTGTSEMVGTDGTSTITVLSTDAQIVVANASDFDPRAFLINGFTGVTYLDDSSVWNVTNWDGLTPLASLQLAISGIDGDYNNDGLVDAADYTAWRDNLGASITLPNDTTPGTVTIADYTIWKSNFNNMPGSLTARAVPEPRTLLLAIAMGIVVSAVRRTVGGIVASGDH